MKLNVLITFVILLFSCQTISKNINDDVIIVKGTIKNLDGQVVLTKLSFKKDKLIQDTTYKTNVNAKGDFTFNFHKDTEAYYIFSWGSMFEKQVNSKFKKNYFILYLDSSNIFITGDAKDKESFVIHNSPISNISLEIDNFMDKQKQSILTLEHENDSIMWANIYTDSLVLESLLKPYNDKMQILQNQTKKKLLEYYNRANHPFMDLIVLSNMIYALEMNVKKSSISAIFEKKELQTLVRQSIQKYPQNKFIMVAQSQINNLK